MVVILPLPQKNICSYYSVPGQVTPGRERTVRGGEGFLLPRTLLRIPVLNVKNGKGSGLLFPYWKVRYWKRKQTGRSTDVGFGHLSSFVPGVSGGFSWSLLWAPGSVVGPTSEINEDLDWGPERSKRGSDSYVSILTRPHVHTPSFSDLCPIPRPWNRLPGVYVYTSPRPSHHERTCEPGREGGKANSIIR